MLVRFNVKNFLSFSSRIGQDNEKILSQEFSMLPGKVHTKKEHLYESDRINLLKFAAVYGANASGKSNFVKAISFAKRMILNGKVPSGTIDSYCKTDVANKDKPSYFEFEILFENQVYSYGFEVVLNTGSIVSEWLFRLSKTSEECLFAKDGVDSPYIFDNDLSKVRDLDVYAYGIKGSDVLLLSTMNKNKDGFYEKNFGAGILKKIYNWFSHCLHINYPNNPISNYSYLNNVSSVHEVEKLLKFFDTGIIQVDKIEISQDELFAKLPQKTCEKIEGLIEKEKRQFNSSALKSKRWNAMVKTKGNIFTLELDKSLKLKVYMILLKHDEKKDVYFNFSEESDGTNRLFDLIEIFLSEDSKVFVIDEFDRCLHPSLTYEFVKIFLTHVKQKRIQLIITTHESRLLDFDLLRRDEIWFVNKNNSGETDIYSLEEYNERFDKKIDKAYLEGRYGGVPLFTAVFPVHDEENI